MYRVLLCNCHWLACKTAWLQSRQGGEHSTDGSLIQLSDGRNKMTSILRSPQALQLTLALIKPDAVAHPLMLEVRMTPKSLLCFLGNNSVSGATGPLVKTDNTILS